MDNCPYTKIAVMQLFYELKQKFPTIPDHVVTDCLKQNSYNKDICKRKLREEYRKHQLRCYPSEIADKMSEGKEKRRPNSLPLSKGNENSHNNNFKKRGYHKGSLDSVSNWEENNKALKNINESVKNINISNSEPDIVLTDLTLHLKNDNNGSEKTSLFVKYQKEGAHSAPSTPSEVVKSHRTKHRSYAKLDNVSHIARSMQKRRPSTSVNLTLRPASCERQAPIDISTKGSTLTYSTSTFDGSQGYQNQLHISISDEGNATLVASRTKTSSPTQPAIPLNNLFNPIDSIQYTIKLRLAEQISCKEKLENELEKDRNKLEIMQKEVIAMKAHYERKKRPITMISAQILRLRTDVKNLQIICKEMIDKIDISGWTVPLGETNREYYEDSFDDDDKQIAIMPTSSLTSNLNLGDNGSWICRLCTFRNHAMLPKCEQCEMVRVDLNNVLPNLLRPSAATSQPTPIHPPRV